MKVRVLLAALAILAMVSGTAHAQLTGGNVSGVITDQQGGVLPGVAVTAQGVDATQSFTTDADGKYRFLNLAPGTYKVTAALPGFTTVVRDNVIIAVGKNVDLPFQLKIAAVAETVTVSGESPIVDTKATGTATNFTADELQKIPTSRDPFALMRTVPGVLVDRVNIAGNETGQQSNFMSKGTRPADAVWTMDGVNITDMAATGASPSYYNFDMFDEIQVSTSGQDIKQPTGGMGINMVIKRGTNQFKGLARGFFTNDNLEACNVPAERTAAGVTCDTADHNKQISDYGFEFGGPLLRDKAWFFGSYSLQDIRLVRSAGNLVDRTQLKNPDVKVSWQASKKDMVSFLYFDGFKIKEGRSPGDAGILFDTPTATFHQDNAYTDARLHGLWKIEDNRVFGSNMFVTGRAAFFNTGFILDPIGGLDQQAGQSVLQARSFGSTRQSKNIRPQHIYNVDANNFFHLGMGDHNIKYGFGYRTAEGGGGTIWPGNMILAEENSATDTRARVFRTSFGDNRAYYLDFYAGDTMTAGRATLDFGVRYDRQYGKALPATTVSNPAFPNLLPGVVFAGYDSPFTWSNFSPRAGLTYAVDDSRKTVLHASFSRYAGQLDPGTVGYLNLTSGASWAEFPWKDANGDHFAQASEVDVTVKPLATANYNPANPTAVVSPNRIDPNLKALKTTTAVAGVTRELMPNLAVIVDYSYTRTSDWNYTPWVNVTTNDYQALTTPPITGTIPGFGGTYSVPVYQPNAAIITANGNARIETNVPGYYTYYNGLEMQVVKRMSNRWMARVGLAFNSSDEHYDVAVNPNANGNITPTDTAALKTGGVYAPRSSGSGSGDIFVNGRWSFNGNALYQLPYGINAGVNVFGRQGYPFPFFRSVSLGQDGSQRVLVSTDVDQFRLKNLWDTDLRVSKNFKLTRVNLELIGDLFNVTNSNTELVRVRNATASNFDQLAQNLSPRILRFGVRLNF